MDQSLEVLETLRMAGFRVLVSGLPKAYGAFNWEIELKFTGELQGFYVKENDMVLRFAVSKAISSMMHQMDPAAKAHMALSKVRAGEGT